jgi:uncharacterized protein
MAERFSVTSMGMKVVGVATLPEGVSEPVPCVILSHGLVSSKESTKYLLLSDLLLASGIASCRFDFHGCGESDGNLEETTLSIRLDNLKKVIEWARDQKKIDSRRIGLLGSSFGSATSLAAASRDKTIRCVSLWATPHVLDSKQDASIDGIDFKNDIFNDFNTYNLLQDAQTVSRGLVIHGSNDEVVPWSEGETIFKHLGEPKHFELIEGADHTFSEAEHREKAFSLALEWCKKYL